MHINSISNNSFKGLIIGTKRVTEGFTGGAVPQLIGDDEIQETIYEQGLFKKLNNKNTDVVILNSSDGTKRDIFLLNSTKLGDSYIPCDSEGEPYAVSIDNVAQNLGKSGTKLIKGGCSGDCSSFYLANLRKFKKIFDKNINDKTIVNEILKNINDFILKSPARDTIEKNVKDIINKAVTIHEINQFNGFINRVKEYAELPNDDTDRPEEKFIDTELGEDLFNVMNNDDIELTENSVVNTPEEVFPVSALMRKY